MNDQIVQISKRIRELREILEMTPEEAAAKVGITPETYRSYEAAQADITIGVLYGIAAVFGVDPTELMTGESPRMDEYTIVRKGQGIKVERYSGYAIYALAFNFKNRDMDPMIVTLSHTEESDLGTHAGQEFNYVLEGTITVVVGKRQFMLNEGDCIYFNAKLLHGQRAVTPVGKFLTIINEKQSLTPSGAFKDAEQ